MKEPKRLNRIQIIVKGLRKIDDEMFQDNIANLVMSLATLNSIRDFTGVDYDPMHMKDFYRNDDGTANAVRETYIGYDITINNDLDFGCIDVIGFE